ncbi:MAG: dihydroneopterin aldolase [bacterium]
MDRIFFRDMQIPCIIGVNDWEREIEQVVKIDLDLEVDLVKAGQEDDIRHTVDYKEVRDRVAFAVRASSCHLLEALAHKVAEASLADLRVQAVRVRLEKPGALRMTRTVGVEIRRSRP